MNMRDKTLHNFDNDTTETTDCKRQTSIITFAILPNKAFGPVSKRFEGRNNSS